MIKEIALRTTSIFFLSSLFIVCSFQVFSDENKVNQNSTFCFVGDTGHVNEIQKEVAESLADSECNAIWHTGDIIYPSGISSEDDPRFRTNFLDPFEKALNKKIPFFLTLGNHDYKKEPESYLGIARNNALIIYPNNYYSKKYGNLCIFALDTTIFDKLYLFYKRREQASWLRAQKKELMKSCNFSIAVAHHPLFSSGDRRKASPQLSKFLNSNIFGTFDLYIAGHNHVLADEGEKDGTVQLISGTGSLPGGSPQMELEGRFNREIPGYLRMKLHDKDQEITAEYQFIASKSKLILWSNSKKGEGIRK